MKAITNAAVGRVLNLIADLLEVRGGDDAAKAPAYRRAARAVEAYPEDVSALHSEGRLREIPGVGEALARKIGELVDTGRLRYLERLSSEVPSGVLDFLRVPGVGVKTASLLWRELGLKSLDQLEEAARSGALRRLPGLGPKKEEAILAGIAAHRREAARRPLGLARPVGQALAEELGGLPGVDRVAVAGSVRRWRETAGNLNLVVATDDPAGVAEAFARLPEVREVLERAEDREDRVRAVLHYGLEVDLRLVPPERFAAAVAYYTGSAGHNEGMARRARAFGLGYDERGLVDQAGQPVAIESEEDVYRRLDLPAIPPELREAGGEIEAAATGKLPRLVELGDIRGDLHVHSDWSDGTASLEGLVAAGRQRGYEYLAVTDHSKALAMARGLDEKRLLAQKEAIDALNARLAGAADEEEGGPGFRLLAGVEVDILGGGELDLADSALAEMDIVTASVHSGLRQPAERMTERLVRAAENEHVDVLGHPTGRLIGEREASALDLEAVLEAAARAGTMVEINASPERLDLKDTHARRAKELGCRLTISTDAHHVRVLDDMAYGVATARRAWLGPDDVANTRPWPDLRKLLRR